MAYTLLNTDTLTNILQSYPIGELQGYQPLTGGLENTNYLVQTTTGEMVLTLCEQKSRTEALHLAQLLTHLNENGLSTTQVIKTRMGAWVSDYNGKPVLLKTYFKGTITRLFTNQQMEAIGQQLATLHHIPPLAFVPTQLGYGIEQFKKAEMYAPDAPFCTWLSQTQSYIETFLSEDLPKALIHSDLFFNNVIVDPSTTTLTLIDFEEAAYYYRIYDLGMTLVGICSFDSQLNLEKSQHLLRGYQQQQSLTDAEKTALQAFAVYAATATAYWRYTNFNFVRPNESKKDLYREMQALATNIRAISPSIFRSIL